MTDVDLSARTDKSSSRGTKQLDLAAELSNRPARQVTVDRPALSWTVQAADSPVPRVLKG
jgi:hypothetical protein